MAKFRDTVQPSILDALPQAPGVSTAAFGTPPPAVEHDGASEASQRAIGDYLADLRDLKPEQVERILQHQVQHGVRFGEAAVALGLASKDDVPGI